MSKAESKIAIIERLHTEYTYNTRLLEQVQQNDETEYRESYPLFAILLFTRKISKYFYGDSKKPAVHVTVVLDYIKDTKHEPIPPKLMEYTKLMKTLYLQPYPPTIEGRVHHQRKFLDLIKQYCLKNIFTQEEYDKHLKDKTITQEG